MKPIFILSVVFLIFMSNAVQGSAATTSDDPVQQEVQKLIPHVTTDKTREKLSAALKKVNPTDLPSVVKYTQQLVPDNRFIEEELKVIQYLSFIPVKEHAVGIAQLSKLIPNNIENFPYQIGILRIFSTLNSMDRKIFVKQVKHLLTSDMEGFEIFSILINCKNLYDREGIKPFPIFVKRVKQLLKNIKSSSTRGRIIIEFTDVPSSQYKSFVKQIKQLNIDSIDNRIFLKIMSSLLSIPEAERDQRVQETLRNLEATREKGYLTDKNIGLYTMGFLIQKIKSPEQGREILAQIGM